MSGKLIMKRKREEDVRLSESDSSSSLGNSVKRACVEPAIIQQPEQQQRHIEEHPIAPVPNVQNKILLEALQKIIELQQELDDFENDLNASEMINHSEDGEVSFYFDEQAAQERQEQEGDDEEEIAAYRRHEAEELGYTMCVREALSFLRDEGVTTDSLLYQSLRAKLSERTDGIVPI